MPELPEVETVANDLNQYLRGKIIARLELIGRHSLVKNSWPDFKKSLQGKKVLKVYRRAKMIVVALESGYLLFHLKMTGQLIYVLKKSLVAGGHPIASTGVAVPNKFTRLIFHFKNGGVLYFNDIRKFGWVKFLKNEAFEALDKATGLEPLSKEFTFKRFEEILQRRSRTSLKAALLDQKHLVGLGNIYVDEVLYNAGLSPKRLAGSLKEKEKIKLFKAIPLILKKSIARRGTTFSDFLDAQGRQGGFAALLKVYGRASLACPRCGAPIIKSRLAGRGTHWCKNCQK
jgi:formamidopyrimidine-DNA glycosylase